MLTNFLAETNRVLEDNGKTALDVLFVASFCGGYDNQVFALGSWVDFAKLANFQYDSVYGGAGINMKLVIVGDNWWLERGGYDGSEWWNFKTMPLKPIKSVPLDALHIREE